MKSPRLSSDPKLAQLGPTLAVVTVYHARVNSVKQIHSFDHYWAYFEINSVRFGNYLATLLFNVPGTAGGEGVGAKQLGNHGTAVYGGRGECPRGCRGRRGMGGRLIYNKQKLLT